MVACSERSGVTSPTVGVLQVLIPSRVHHPCVMSVEAVFVDTVNAYVRAVSVSVPCSRVRMRKQIHCDAMVRWRRHGGMAVGDATQAHSDAGVLAVARRASGTWRRRVTIGAVAL